MNAEQTGSTSEPPPDETLVAEAPRLPPITIDEPNEAEKAGDADSASSIDEFYSSVGCPDGVFNVETFNWDAKRTVTYPDVLAISSNGPPLQMGERLVGEHPMDGRNVIISGK